MEIDLIDTFVSKWNRNEEPRYATTQEVEEVENKLKILLPESYKYLVKKFGDVYTPNVLDEIVDRELEISDVQNFSLPAQAAEDTAAYIEAGMPDGFLAFANDCMGNMFCFKLNECTVEIKEPPIWFFDHDFITIKKIYNNFGDWLTKYVEL
jgi:SMI1/KNR4 family protein SUKH-1